MRSQSRGELYTRCRFEEAHTKLVLDFPLARFSSGVYKLNKLRQMAIYFGDWDAPERFIYVYIYMGLGAAQTLVFAQVFRGSGKTYIYDAMSCWYMCAIAQWQSLVLCD